MLEQNLSQNIEAEIAELSRQIEAKRRLLETEHGIIEDKQVIKAVVKEFVPATRAGVSSSTEIVSDGDASYLDNLDNITSSRVSELVGKVFERGLARTIAEAKKLNALEVDAFHDTLTDRLYGELKNRGLV